MALGLGEPTHGPHTLAPADPSPHPLFGRSPAVRGERGRWDHRPEGHEEQWPDVYGCIDSRLPPKDARKAFQLLRTPGGNDVSKRDDPQAGGLGDGLLQVGGAARRADGARGRAFSSFVGL